MLGNVSMSAKKFASWFICELKALALNYHHSLRTSVRGVKTIKYSSSGVCEFLAEMTLTYVSNMHTPVKVLQFREWQC